MIDTARCMAPKNNSEFGGPRCQEEATHETVMGRRCERHAEDLRESLRDPNTLGNLFAGGRGRTEKEIEQLVRPLPSWKGSLQ